LYFILLRLWRRAFGSGEAAVRSLSIIASVAGVLALFDACVMLGHPGMALAACLLMALAPPQVRLAQDARGYALMVTLSLLAAAAVTRLAVRGPGLLRCVALGACLLGMMLTHYYAVAPAAAIVLYAAVRLRGRALRQAAVAVALAAVLFLVAWGPMLGAQAEAVGRNNQWLREAPGGHAGLTLERAVAAPALLLTDPCPPDQPATWTTSAAVMGVGILALGLTSIVWRREGLLLWGMWLWAAVGLVAAVDQYRSSGQLAYLRYVAAAGPAVCVLLALAIPALPQRPWRLMRWAVPGAAAVACLTALPYAVGPYRPGRQDWREMAAYLSTRVSPADALVFHCAPDGPWRPGVPYLCLSYYLPDVRCPVVLLDGPAGDAVLRRLRECRRVWVVSNSAGDNASEGETLLPGYRLVLSKRFYYSEDVLVAERVPAGSGSGS
jgi:4-amino-4-deoxy-L-arabinose transferase-like glycosyltransferase